LSIISSSKNVADEINNTTGDRNEEEEEKKEDGNNDDSKQHHQHTETECSAQTKREKDMNPGNKMAARVQEAW